MVGPGHVVERGDLDVEVSAGTAESDSNCLAACSCRRSARRGARQPGPRYWLRHFAERALNQSVLQLTGSRLRRPPQPEPSCPTTPRFPASDSESSGSNSLASSPRNGSTTDLIPPAHLPRRSASWVATGNQPHTPSGADPKSTTPGDLAGCRRNQGMTLCGTRSPMFVGGSARTTAMIASHTGAVGTPVSQT